jgi:hypothetical protein
MLEKKIPEETLSRRKDIQALAEQINKKPFSTPEYRRVALGIDYVSVSGEQTNDGTTTHKRREGERVTANFPLHTTDTSSYSAAVTIESSRLHENTKGHFTLYKEDQWDGNGNPSHYTLLDSQDLPILEGKSFLDSIERFLNRNGQLERAGARNAQLHRSDCGFDLRRDYLAGAFGYRTIFRPGQWPNVSAGAGRKPFAGLDLDQLVCAHCGLPAGPGILQR